MQIARLNLANDPYLAAHLRTYVVSLLRVLGFILCQETQGKSLIFHSVIKLAYASSLWVLALQ